MKHSAGGPEAAAVEPPYYAVIFSSRLAETDAGYAEMADDMLELACGQPGFLGVESAREAGGLGITISYWRDEQAIAAWKSDLDHQQAQRIGREQWYRSYSVKVARVERAYDFQSS